MVEVDAVLFEQALFNILDNAAKYAPAGTTIRVESEQDGPFVVLRVLDEGDGIPPGDVEHIFDKFYRARKGDQVRPGTGLGLAIARGFIEAMRVRSRRPTAMTGRARRSPSAFRFAPTSGLWRPLHDRAAAQGSGGR